MSKLTDEQIEDLYFDEFSISKLKEFARAIEAAATEPLLQRIAELEDSLSAWRRNAELADQANRELESLLTEKHNARVMWQSKAAELERQLEEARKDAERWNHACKGNHKNINVCAWDADSYEFVGYAMKKEAIDAIADAQIAAMQKGQT